ncbi:MAG: hypothetical protein GVY21_08495 [Gammaproteobacteria bacterium]|jgi:hypothetical protein|nr:hypothetical protein [Gammaproteobacteria bacterium]
MIKIHSTKRPALVAAITLFLAACGGGGGGGGGDTGGTNPPPPAPPQPPPPPTSVTFTAELTALELEDTATGQPVNPAGLPVQGATLTRN